MRASLRLALLALVAQALACSKAAPDAPPDDADTAEGGRADAVGLRDTAGGADVVDSDGPGAEQDVGADADDPGPMGWVPMPGVVEPCPLFLATKPEAIAPLAWLDCGPGCRVLDHDAEVHVFNRGSTAGNVFDGDVLLRFNESSPRGEVLRTVRLSDGRTLGALEQRGEQLHCIPTGMAKAARFLTTSARPAMPGHFYIGKVTTPAEAFRLAPVAVGKAVAVDDFEWDEGLGYVFYGGAIRLLRDGKLETIASEFTEWVDADRDLIVWGGSTGKPGEWALRGYDRAHGTPVTMATVPGVSLETVAISPQHVVAIGLKDRTSSGFSSARVYSGARPAGAVPVPLSAGAELPGDAGLRELRTGGDFLATDFCDTQAPGGTVCDLAVAQLSTGKVWRIPKPAGEFHAKILAVSSTDIVVGTARRNAPAGESALLRRIYRYSTARLDELVASRKN